MKYTVEVEGRRYEIHLDGESVSVDGNPVRLDVRQIADLQLYSLLIDGESFEVSVEEEGPSHYNVILSGELYSVAVRSEGSPVRAASAPQKGGDGVVRAPMPGMVAAVGVEAGQEVSAGQTLIVLESMKMENPLQAPSAGLVAELHVAVGDTVEKNQVVITIIPAGTGSTGSESESDGGS